MPKIKKLYYLTVIKYQVATLILSVTQPCHEKWEEMTPAGRGVFCQSCSKHVIDFSAMTDGDILDYFQKREGQPVCGRFRNSQLNRPLLEISPSVFSMNIPLWKKFLAAVFICFSAFITGCSTPDERDYTALQVPPATEQPAAHTEEIILNKVNSVTPVQQPKKTSKKQKKKGKQKIQVKDNWLKYLDSEGHSIAIPTESVFTTTWGFTTSAVYHGPDNNTLIPVPFPDLKKTKTN